MHGSLHASCTACSTYSIHTVCTTPSGVIPPPTTDNMYAHTYSSSGGVHRSQPSTKPSTTTAVKMHRGPSLPYRYTFFLSVPLPCHPERTSSRPRTGQISGILIRTTPSRILGTSTDPWSHIPGTRNPSHYYYRY